MKSYNQDQKKFVTACKCILNDDYSAAAQEANNEKAKVMREPSLDNELKFQKKNRANAAANRVMCEWCREVGGILNVPAYMKAEAEAKKKKKRFVVPNSIQVKANPGNKIKSTVKRSGFSLNDALNETYNKARVA